MLIEFFGRFLLDKKGFLGVFCIEDSLKYCSLFFLKFSELNLPLLTKNYSLSHSNNEKMYEMQ